MLVGVFIKRGSSTDFGVLGLELSLNERLREGLLSVSFWERVEDDTLRLELPGDGFLDELDDDFLERPIPKIESSSSLRRWLIEEGVSERGGAES